MQGGYSLEILFTSEGSAGSVRDKSLCLSLASLELTEITEKKHSPVRKYKETGFRFISEDSAGSVRDSSFLSPASLEIAEFTEILHLYF